MLLITHDLGVVAQNCDDVAIIYTGEIVEVGSIKDVYRDKLHPYTKGLFGSIPSLSSTEKRLRAIEGMMPDPARLPRVVSSMRDVPALRNNANTIFPN